jgi:riboflavin kinase/FMN adenylyltransferase
MIPSLHRFRARVVRGAGRGKQLDVPTLNFDLADVPPELDEGIYACRITANEVTYPGAMHYGPRPVFKDSKSLEVHLIDTTMPEAPEACEIAVIERLRDVKDFASAEDLRSQMQDDISTCRAILGA